MQVDQYATIPTITASRYLALPPTDAVQDKLYLERFQPDKMKKKEQFQCYKGNTKIKNQTNQPTKKLEIGTDKFLEKVSGTNRFPRQSSAA